jgi:hypothetical protein
LTRRARRLEETLRSIYRIMAGHPDDNVTKQPATAEHPHDFSATFSATLTDVPLLAGWNRFQLRATDVYGYTGAATVDLEVSANPPEEQDLAVILELDDDLHANPQAGPWTGSWRR